MAKSTYEVIVGNIGAVYLGQRYTDARDAFEEYKRMSLSYEGRAAGEDVTMMRDGEIDAEFKGVPEPVTAYPLFKHKLELTVEQFESVVEAYLWMQGMRGLNDMDNEVMDKLVRHGRAFAEWKKVNGVK